MLCDLAWKSGEVLPRQRASHTLIQCDATPDGQGVFLMLVVWERIRHVKL